LLDNKQANYEEEISITASWSRISDY